MTYPNSDELYADWRSVGLHVDQFKAIVRRDFGSDTRTITRTEYRVFKRDSLAVLKALEELRTRTLTHMNGCPPPWDENTTD